VASTICGVGSGGGWVLEAKKAAASAAGSGGGVRLRAAWSM